ncbi:hypothetical protein BaRGS_00007496 [Batillaria attramentaria]|uniref:Secreted protein n=1 Tax=Batillaria attramentaria TaxID=370345 RepID=A0ABD0LPG8_9CAEN
MHSARGLRVLFLLVVRNHWCQNVKAEGLKASPLQQMNDRLMASSAVVYQRACAALVIELQAEPFATLLYPWFGLCV